MRAKRAALPAAIAAALLALSVRPAVCDEPSAPHAVSLAEAVHEALEHNLDLAIEKVQPQIAHQQIRAAQSEFNPLFGVSGNYAHNVRFLNSALEQAADDGVIHENYMTPETSLSGRLTSGTEYDFSLSAPRIESDHPLRLFDTSYTPMAKLTITQPLLRNFGIEVNKVRIRQAVQLEHQAVLGVEAKMLVVIRDVETMYWELAYAQRAIEVADANVTVAADLIERLTRLKTAGLATALDVSQAEAASEARKADRARAGADLLNAQARLRITLDASLDNSSRPVATEGPAEAPPPDDLPGRIERGLARRPEIKIQESVIDSLALEERLAKSNTRWSLDAVGGASYGGLAGRDVGPRIFGPLPGDLDNKTTYGDAFADGQTSWLLGLKLQIPIGNGAADSQLQTTRQRQHQEELRLELIKSQIRVDIETAFQDMTAGRALLDSSREQVEFAGRLLDAETRNLEAGRTTVRKVLEAQDHLASARILEQRALTNFSAARSRLTAAQGISLDAYHLEVEQP